MTITQNRFDTELCADSCEFSPFSTSNDLVVVGTYQVMPSVCADAGDAGDAVDADTDATPFTQVTARCGALMVFSASSSSLELIERINCAAILDIKWSHALINLWQLPKDSKSEQVGAQCIAAADATGNVIIYSIETVPKKLREICRYTTEEENVLCLSVDWSNRIAGKLSAGIDSRIVVSKSNGDLSLLELSNTSLVERETWNAHGFEAWIVSFDAWRPDSVIYSGGDDCILKSWDIRSGTARETMKSRKHSAGVCSIQSNPHREYILATGRYPMNAEKENLICKFYCHPPHS
ncbi:Diphthine methyltransferase [Physocladia obscura]|uniref:Diphthine methyltransferase n=1 Tax=Physocladia obscura TaxID=109957 RepID=A0AAD5T123_9FUNG|nr:Diphthine methyltransferase [Physocladia obscura]